MSDGKPRDTIDVPRCVLNYTYRVIVLALLHQGERKNGILTNFYRLICRTVRDKREGSFFFDFSLELIGDCV